MPPAFSDSTSAPGPVAVLELGDEPVAGAAGEAAVVAGDRHAGDLGEVVGQLLAPLGEVGEDEDPLAGREHRLDDLLEAGQLARAAGERPVVVLVGGGVVADLLERGDGGEDRALLAARRPALGGVGDEVVEHGLVEADLLGGHRAVVELVDRSGSSAATSGSVLVRRNTRMPLRARSAASPSPDSWAMNAGRAPTRPGLVKSRIAHRSPRPFSIGVPVSASRVRAGMRRSCCAVSLAGFLIACASSRTSRSHVDARPAPRRRGPRCRRW